MKTKFGILALALIVNGFLSFPLQAQRVAVNSFARDGRLTWTADQTNVYLGIEFAFTPAGPWEPAPLPYWNFRATDYTMSVDIPLASITDPQMFFRILCSTNVLAGQETYDVISNGIPRFVTSDYLESDKIGQVSKFRSGEGHDYSDDFESCRSMKHYFWPRQGIDQSTIKIFAPVAGTIRRLQVEGFPNSGTQVQIKSAEYPAFYFILFHVNLTAKLSVGMPVSAGQLLGYHPENPSLVCTDIAVRVQTPTGEKLISFFSVMTDDLFAGYLARGVLSRSDFIISKPARDADPLICNGEQFLNPGTIPNWVSLNP